MLPICFHHAKKANDRGQSFDSILRNRGTCGAPGCENIGYYALKPARNDDTSHHDAKTPRQAEKILSTRFAPLGEPPTPPPRRNGAGPIPCDGSATCPHCILSRVSPASAAYIPAGKPCTPRTGT